MGKRGPARKPTALKELAGNPGKRPLNKREPKYPVGNRTCPAHLKGEARREWNRVVPSLEIVGVYQSVDRAALAAYCTAWADYVDADKQCRDAGKWLKDSHGVWRQAPWYRIKATALEKLKQFAREFGFTPASRTELVDPRDLPDDDELAVLEKKRDEWRAKKKRAN